MFNVEEFLKSRKLEHTYKKLVESDLSLESIFELIYRDYDIGYEIVYGKKASSFWKLFKPEERIAILKKIYNFFINSLTLSFLILCKYLSLKISIPAAMKNNIAINPIRSNTCTFLSVSSKLFKYK